MINKFLKATKFCTLCFLFLLSSFHNNLLAQTDTLFYVPPILDWGAGTATNRIQLEMLFSTNFPRAVVRIRTPSNSFSATVTVLSGITTNYVMPENTNLFDGTSRSTVGSYDRLLPFAVRNDIGIIIQSDFPVSVIQKLNDHTSNLSLNNNEELIILKGSNGLGTQFRAGSQTVVDGAGSWTSDDKQFIGVMASQNGTLVTISGPTNFVGVTLPAVVNMNAGESFVMGTTNSYDIVAGTRIFSNKPVSVTTGSQHTRIAPGLAGDAGIDNLVPYNLLGTQYIAVNGGGSNPYDYVVVVPTQDNTIVRVDGVIVDADLDEAENYMRFSFPTSVLGVGRPHSIETSSPAYVFHIASRATNNEVGMSLLPQLNCTGSKQIGFQIDNILSNIINFVVPTSALSSFRLNNQSTTALGVTIRTVTGLSNWSAFNVNIASGAAVVDYDAIASEKFHVGILGANGGTGLYGYISGFDQRFTLFDIFNTTLPTTGFSSLGGYCPNTAISNKLTLGSCGQFHSITGFTTKFGSNITTSLIGINKVDFSINPPTSTFIGCDTIKYIVKNDLGQTDSVTVEACWGPTKVAAGIDFGTCGSSTRLPAEFMRFGVGRWSQVSGPNTASISNVLDRNATVTGLVDGVYNFRWTGSLSGCNVVSDDVLLGVTCAPVYPINADTDGDGIPNDIDLDDDNDGITDVVEYCGINGFTNGNPELITNGNFSVLASGIFPLAANTNWAGWRSSVPYHGNNIYPPDTRVAIQSGNINYVGGIVTQVTFPGDAFFGVPPSSTYLYANGNTTAGAYLLCSQTITGVSPASVYEITSYVSNGVDPTGSSPNDPLLYYFIGNTSVTGSFKQVYDHSDPLSGHGGVDRWDRWTSNYTTGPSQTVLGFSIRDFQIGSNRDEFAITRISIKKQGYGCLDADPLQDSDFDGVQNYRDSDYCLAIGSSINIKGVCASLDFDTDGIINSIDLDSDNDGIYDLFEAGHNATDANNDGKVDGAVGTNGFLNTLEASDATTLGIAMTYTLLNSDSVSGVDFLDLDSDNDGCFDAREAGFLDQNNDGNLGNIPLTVSTISGTVTSGIGYTRPATITGLTYYYRTATSGIGCTPETTIDGFLALEDVSSITGSVLTNDYNPLTNGTTALSITGFNGTITGGTLSLTGTGNFIFVPNLNYNGITSYTYTICNIQACTTANLVFTIIGVNDAPFVSITPNTISGIAGTTNSGTITGFGDVDNPLSQLTVSGLNPISSGPNGTVNTITGGTVTISGTGAVIFQGTIPGIHTLNYQVCDPTVTCTSAVLTISISGAVPIPTNDGFSTNENTSISGNLLTNDFNPNTNASVTGLTLNTSPTLLGANIGTLSVNGAGGFTFVPSAELAQGVTTVTTYRYQVCNNIGCSTAQAVFSVTGVNDPPIATNINTSTTSNTSITGTLLFTDPDGIVTVTSQNLTNTSGTFTVSTTGGYSFIPNGTFTGITSFTVNGCDLFTCTSAIVTVTVLQNTLNPIANSDINNVLESGTITGNVLTNDINPITGLNTQLTVTGIVVQSPIGNVIITNSLTGAYTFIPNANVELAAGITTTTSAIYQVCNVNGCSTAQIAITITGVNDPPIATNINTSTTSNTSITGTLLFTDPDGIVTVTSQNLTNTSGTFTVSTTGGYSFIPNGTFTGITSFTVNGCDLFTCTSAIVTVTVLQNTLNPIANSDINNVLESGTFTGNVLTNDINPITGLNTQLTVTGIVVQSPIGNVIITNSLTGAYTFIPNANVELAAGITTTTSAIYQVCNVNGCSTAQIAITITGVNDAPIATNVNTSTTSNTSISGTVPFTDPDGIVTVTSQNLTNTSGTFTVSTTGGYSFIPNGTFTGISQFTVSGCDLFTCTSAIVTVTVLQNTLNPIANSDINNVLESGTITGNILTNDINPITGLNTQLTVTGIVVQSPIGNVIITNSLTGAYTFIPNANVELAQGVTTITSAIYQVCNVNGCSTAQISFTITGVNDAPIATNLSTSTTSNTSITGTVPFTDPDGLVTVTSQNITNPTGTFNVNTTGGYSFIPNGTFTGITSFTVNGCDLFTCTSAIVTVTVLQNTLNPKAVNDINTVLESGTTTGNILTNDINPITGLNTQLTVTGIVVQSPLGNVIITNSLTGAYTFIPNANVELAAGVTTTTSAIYNVCNVNGCSTAQISFTITGVNDAPIATNVNTSTTSNTSISGTVPFTDPDGIVTVTSQNLTNTSGTFTVSTTDGYSFIPNGTFTGITSFTVNGCDLFTCTSAIVTVTVLQNTLNPKVVNDINTVLESGTTTGNILTNDINPITGLNTQLTVTGIVVQSPLGNVIITNSLTGAYTFIPNANVELAAGVTTTTSAIYNVCNVNGCSTAQISFTITGVNDAPIATNVNTSTTSNTSISGTVVFTDPDGAVTVTSQNVTNPTGTFTVSTAGGYTFIPNGTFTGISQFTVSGCDLFTCTSAIVTVTVLQNTLNPIANSDINNVLESGTITGNVLTNDINPITGLNTQLTVTGIVVQSPIGNVIITNSLTGAYTFIPNANVELAAGITTTTSAIYQVCNVNGCSTAQIAITITGVNDAPIAISLTETTNEDVPLNATISGFADADNLISELTVSTVSSGLPSNGTLILNPNGTYTYTPNPNFNGNDTFTYQVCDLNTCTSATVNITINSQNDRPIALNTTFSGFEETTISGVLVNNSLTGNYYDLDGDLLSINSISGFATSNGIVSISNNGTFIYIPNSNFSGIDIYTYQVCDASNLCAQAQIIFSITGLNDAPIFPATTISGIEDVPLIGNISGVLDPENDTMTITGISTSPNGILTVLPNGDYTFTGTNNFSGTIPFTITICDPFTCTSSVVTVIISPINDAPIANNITVIATEDALSVSGTISGINTSNSNNDVFDIDNTTLTITPIPATATTNGTIQLNGNGTYSFTVNSGLILPVGQILTESIPYEVCDLVTCTSANLLITIVGVNDAPVAQNRISATDPSQLVTIQGIATDSDNDVLTYSIINVIVNSSVTGTPIYSINSTTGLVSYTPSSDISIHIDYVIYAACDPSGVCRTAQMAISVPASQFPPNSISANSTFNEDAPSEVINVNSLVSDPNGDAITITGIIPIPSNQGTISLVNGVLTFVPALNFNGTITLTFTGCEVANLTSCTSNVIIINILPINDAPVIANKTKTGNEDSTITGNLLNTPTDNDPDGTILNINTTPISGPSFGNITINADGTYIYVPNSNFKGIDVVTVQICDNGTPLPKICNEIVLSITVNGINDAPIAPLVTIIGNEDMVINHTLTGISDPDAGDILTITTVNGAATANGGTITISGNGVVSYTPAPDFTGNDTYSYEVCDNGTPAICVQSSITIIVAPVNDAPIARDDIYSFNPNQTVSGLIKMKTNDSDPDGNSFVYSVLKHTSSIPANKGIITSLYTTLGEIDYFTGLNSTPRTDTVFYQICDNGVPSKCDSAKLIIVIPASPLLPQVLNENATTPEDVVVNIQIANNDYDPNGETISHTITSQPKNGIAVLNTATGIVTYTPNQNYFGKDTLTYSVCDPTITCTSGFVYVNITPVNDAPIALPLVVNTSFNTPISSTISGYSDVDNVNISVNPFGGTIIGGSLTVNANGTFTFTPNATFTGSTVFNYQVCDPTITCTSSTLTINVSSSTSPILLSDDIQTIEDVSITGNVFTNDTNPLTGNNTGLTITGFINNGNNIGILSINSLTGIYNFVPNVELPQGITTTTSYFYTACYANECSTAQIAITVTGLNDAPIGTNVNTLTTSNTSITGTVPFSDPDGNVTITSQNLTNTSGTFTVSTTGGYTFIPNGTFTGIVSFTIVGCDLFTCTSAVITIDVQNPISTLQVRDDLISTNENTSITGNILSNDLNPITGDNSQITLSGITNILDNIGIFTINSVTGFYSFVPTIELAQGIVTITSAKYTACNLNECLIGQILITVIGVNDAPLVTVNSPINGGNLTGTIPGFITLDPDGDVLTITAVGGIENVGTLTILPNGTYTFIPNPNSTVSGLVPFNITVCDIYTCTSAVIFINIPAKATTEEEVKIPNGFSPNGDGINDDFVIVKPNNSPKVTLKVFNRWGNFVYEKDDYDNTWNGSSNKGIVVGNGGNGLPDGTYYIIVDFNNGSEKTIKYITISR